MVSEIAVLLWILHVYIINLGREYLFLGLACFLTKSVVTRDGCIDLILCVGLIKSSTKIVNTIVNSYHIVNRRLTLSTHLGSYCIVAQESVVELLWQQVVANKILPTAVLTCKLPLTLVENLFQERLCTGTHYLRCSNFRTEISTVAYLLNSINGVWTYWIVQFHVSLCKHQQHISIAQVRIVNTRIVCSDICESIAVIEQFRPLVVVASDVHVELGNTVVGVVPPSDGCLATHVTWLVSEAEHVVHLLVTTTFTPLEVSCTTAWLKLWSLTIADATRNLLGERNLEDWIVIIDHLKVTLVQENILVWISQWVRSRVNYFLSIVTRLG